jgi:hypothetical protein
VRRAVLPQLALGYEDLLDSGRLDCHYGDPNGMRDA